MPGATVVFWANGNNAPENHVPNPNGLILRDIIAAWEADMAASQDDADARFLSFLAGAIYALEQIERREGILVYSEVASLIRAQQVVTARGLAYLVDSIKDETTSD